MDVGTKIIRVSVFLMLSEVYKVQHVHLPSYFCIITLIINTISPPSLLLTFNFSSQP